MHTFVGDGTTTTVVLDETPAGDHTATPQVVFVYKRDRGRCPGADDRLHAGPGDQDAHLPGRGAPAAAEVHVIYYAYIP